MTEIMPPASNINNAALDTLEIFAAASILTDNRPALKTNSDGCRLGYACINTALRAKKPSVFCSRGIVKKSIEKKGREEIGRRALQNCQDLLKILQWNEQNGIRFFRISSDIFPWMSEYDMRSDPLWSKISNTLRQCGRFAESFGHRLTFHPSHFVKLASQDEEYAEKSIRELEVHSLIFDCMGFEPSVYNKINIHVGGVYGDKEKTMRRFAARFEKLSPNCRKRLTVENDDVKTAYSVKDLSFLHELTGIPIVFDFHHNKFCSGELSEREALDLALSTWPPGVTPVVHWSESQEGRKPHAHSDYVSGPISCHDRDVHVMIEAKQKEKSLLKYLADQIQ